MLTVTEVALTLSIKLSAVAEPDDFAGSSVDSGGASDASLAFDIP
jgi:hypothetical protein